MIPGEPQRHIQRRREALGLTISALSRIANVPRSQIGNLERGGRNVGERTLVRVEDALDLIEYRRMSARYKPLSAARGGLMPLLVSGQQGYAQTQRV